MEDPYSVKVQWGPDGERKFYLTRQTPTLHRKPG